MDCGIWAGMNISVYLASGPAAIRDFSAVEVRIDADIEVDIVGVMGRQLILDGYHHYAIAHGSRACMVDVDGGPAAGAGPLLTSHLITTVLDIIFT